MNKTLAIGIDLGGDTAKIAYAIEGDDGATYGKFASSSPLVQIAIPAVAYFDEVENKWLYGMEVDKSSNRTFITVVKIKSLLSLLANDVDNETFEKNKNYYQNKYEFPKFYFPIRKKMLSDFEKMSEQGMTFIANHTTPRFVCEQFFYYLHAIVIEKAMKLENALNITFEDMKISLVHPAHVGDELLTELKRLVECAFGQSVDKALSTTKALTMYADYRGVMGEDKNILVFDMGEEEISVAKACYVGDNLVVEGVEGHNLPLSIGGVNVDEAINDFLEGQISRRETMGKPSYGNEGHVDENSVYGKQYLLMKDIKKAKIILSRPLKEDSAFYNGVPVCVSRDLLLQRLFTKENLLQCVGMLDGTGVASDIYEYVKTELERPCNKRVKKIFISGGLSETYGLIDFLKEKINADFEGVEVHCFNDDVYEGDEFKIFSNEDNAYAAAIGGAIVALKDMEVKTVISLSYATWSFRGEQQKCLDIFVNRGQPIEEGMEFSTQLSLGNDGVFGEEMFSTIITDYEIRGRKYAGDIAYSTSGKLMIGEDDSVYRRAAVQTVDLKIVAGGRRSSIYFKYDGDKISILNGDVIQFEEGIRVDRNGKATPFIRNVMPSKRLEILWRGRTIYVDAKDIEIVFDSVSSFSVSKD